MIREDYPVSLGRKSFDWDERPGVQGMLASGWPTIDDLLVATRSQREATMLDILRGTARVSARYRGTETAV